MPVKTNPPRASRKTSSSPLYAEVAVDLPIRHAYTYAVPEGLRAEAVPGRMARVPVLNKQAAGVILSLSSKSELPKKKIKFIEKILTPEYAIPPDLMELAAWIAEYYLAGPGETLATISFFGLRDEQRVTQRRLVLAESAARALSLETGEKEAGAEETRESLIPSLTRRQREVAAFFQENLNAPITRAELTRRLKCSSGVLNALIEKNVLVEQIAEIERTDGYHATPPPAAQHTLLPEQTEAYDQVTAAINARRFEPFLLYGITGSGKTEIYLRAISLVLEQGRQAIVLVPEISLTPQAVHRFRAWFGDRVGVYHSRLSPGQKYDLWRRIDAGTVRVLVGARSAVFAPFENLGLIVVDEEHEHSYKQSDPAPRYHARDVAVWRARRAGIPVVLGSATPSLESMRNAQMGKYRMLALTRRVGEASLPDIHLIDMGAQVRDERQTGLISTPLREAIVRRLERKEHVILFLNRRGFSNFLLCLSCKTPIRCDHCDVVMTWHKAIGKLMCHLCGETRARPAECPACGTPDPAALGAGTQRIEEEVAALFPAARVLRIDLDTAGGKLGFLNIWEHIESGDYDILLGTQMIAKGLHLERVTLVGVISADHSLFLPDFRSGERTFAQLTQVAGRAGRMQRRGEVFLQTFIPHHYAIQRAVHQDADGFYKQEMHMRETLRFPPHHRLLLARISGLKAERVRERAARLVHLLRERAARGNTYRSLAVYGPTPSPIARIKDRTRWQALIRGQRPSLMRALLFEALEIYEKDKGRTGVSLTLDMDPVDLL